jgi:hypothetical protein
LFVAFVMVTFAVDELGTVLGVQLLALLQRSDTLPFQVWAKIGRGQLRMKTKNSRSDRMRAIPLSAEFP